MSKRISAQFKVVRKSEPRPRQAPLGPELGGAQASEDELCLFNTLSSEATASMVARRLLCLALLAPACAWVVPGARRSPAARRAGGRPLASAVEAEAEDSADDEDALPAMEPTDPEKLLSEVDFDYVPLATMLMTRDYKGADQFTREALITLAGEGSQQRGFVYYTEVPSIPATDLATIELLWNKYSDGRFGYSVQRKQWKLAKGDFEAFCRRIGWTKTVDDVERKRRWFGESEFVYDDSAPKGHLPLTNAIRGTTLIKAVLNHEVWESDWEREL